MISSFMTSCATVGGVLSVRNAQPRHHRIFTALSRLGWLDEHAFFNCTSHHESIGSARSGNAIELYTDDGRGM